MDSRQRNIKIRKQWKFHWAVAVSSSHDPADIPWLWMPKSRLQGLSGVFIINKPKNRWRSTPKSSITVFSTFNWQLRIVKSPKFQFYGVSPQSEAWGRRHMVPKGNLAGWQRDQLNVHCWKRSSVLHWSIRILVPLSRKHWALLGFFRRFPWKAEAERGWLKMDTDTKPLTISLKTTPHPGNRFQVMVATGCK